MKNNKDRLEKCDVKGGAVQHGRGKSVMFKVTYMWCYSRRLHTGDLIHSSGQADRGGQEEPASVMLSL